MSISLFGIRRPTYRMAVCLALVAAVAACGEESGSSLSGTIPRPDDKTFSTDAVPQSTTVPVGGDAAQPTFALDSDDTGGPTATQAPAVVSQETASTVLSATRLEHISPLVAPVGKVELRVETLGLIPVDPKQVNGADLIVQDGDGSDIRTRMAATPAGWAVATDLPPSGLDYRFELATSSGVVQLPVDGGLIHLYATGPEQARLPDALSTVSPASSVDIAFGSGATNLGRSPTASDAGDARSTGPDGVVVTDDGLVAVMDPWNARILTINESGATTDAPLAYLQSALESTNTAAEVDSFVIDEQGGGAYSIGTTVRTFGPAGEYEYDLSTREGYPMAVQDLELHGDLIISSRINGEQQVVGTLSGEPGPPTVNDEPSTMRVNDLSDDGVYVHVPASTVGMITASYDLAPFPGTSRVLSDNTGVAVFYDHSGGRVIVVRLMEGDRISAFSLVDGEGVALTPTSGGLDSGVPSLSVSPNGKWLGVLSCTDSACRVTTYELSVGMGEL